MTPVHQLRVSERAARQIQKASHWWDENRPSAPDAFRDEIERAFLLIATHPGIGSPVPSRRIPGLRRLLLQRIRYHLYYRVSDEGFVEVPAPGKTDAKRAVNVDIGISGTDFSEVLSGLKEGDEVIITG